MILVCNNKNLSDKSFLFPDRPHGIGNITAKMTSGQELKPPHQVHLDSHQLEQKALTIGSDQSLRQEFSCA